MPRGASLVGAVLSLVAVADVRAVVHLHTDRAPCAVHALPSRSALDVSLHVTEPVLRAGANAAGTATLTNRSGARVVVRRADAVLVDPGTAHPLSWVDDRPFRAVDLLPGTYATVPFVVHLAACRDQAPSFEPGFYEVVLVLVEQDGSGVRLRRSSPQAVVLSP